MNNTIRIIYTVNPIGLDVLKIASNTFLALELLLRNPAIVVGILISVDAKITGITEAEFNLIGILESFLPLNVAALDLFAY